MKEGNPFTLTFGKQPKEHIIRYEAVEAIRSTFDAEHAVHQTYLIEGLRGTGKTVLMTTVAAEFKERKDWIVVNLNSTRNLLEDLSQRLSEECEAGRRIKPSGINIAGVGVGINSSASSYDSISKTREILASLKKKKQKLLITIDEVVHNQSIREFASEFQLFVRDDFPVFLLMTGLYENIYAVQNDPELTFLLRSPKIRLEPLSPFRVAKQYRSIFNIDDEKACELAHITKGYAFAFQALGMLYYESENKDSLEDILVELDSMLDEFVYRKIWEPLTTQEKAVLKAFSEPRMKVKDIREAAGMDSSGFSRYRERLVNKGILLGAEYGYLELTLPRIEKIIWFYD